MATIATAYVEVKIDKKYTRELEKLNKDIQKTAEKAANEFHKNFQKTTANITKLSRSMTQALRPVFVAMSALGGLSVKKALEKNDELALRWSKSTSKVNDAMAGVGEKILKASFAGKTLFEWMDKFAASLSKLTQGDVQKLVNAFTTIGIVLGALKVIGIGSGLARSVEGSMSSGITGKQMLGAEVAGGLAQMGATKGAISSQLGASDAIKRSALLAAYNMEAIARDKAMQEFYNFPDKGWAGERSKANARLSTMEERVSLAKYKATEAGSFTAATGGGGISAIAVGAIAIVFGTLLAAIRMNRTKLDEETGKMKDAWDKNSGTFTNIFSELTETISDGLKGLEWVGRVAGQFHLNATKGILGVSKAEMGFITGEINNTGTKYPTGPSGMTTEELTRRGLSGSGRSETAIRQTYHRSLLKEALEEKALKLQEESLRYQEIYKKRLEDNAKTRKDIEEAQKKMKEAIKEAYKTADDLRMEEVDAMSELKENAASKFKYDFGGAKFYSAEESYKAATGWQHELINYEKEKREFEKEKAKKNAAIVLKLGEIATNGKNLDDRFKALEAEAQKYNSN